MYPPAVVVTAFELRINAPSSMPPVDETEFTFEFTVRTAVAPEGIITSSVGPGTASQNQLVAEVQAVVLVTAY